MRNSPVVVLIECAPAAIAILHGDQPCQAATRRSFQAHSLRDTSRAAAPSAQTRCHPHRDKNRCETQTPSRPARTRIFHLPIAAAQAPDASAATPPHVPARDDPAGTPASSSATIAIAVSHTGETHGCMRIVSSILNFKLRELVDFARGKRIVRRMAQSPSAQKSRSSSPDKSPPARRCAPCVRAASHAPGAARAAAAASTAALRKS